MDGEAGKVSKHFKVGSGDKNDITSPGGHLKVLKKLDERWPQKDACVEDGEEGLDSIYEFKASRGEKAFTFVGRASHPPHEA